MSLGPDHLNRLTLGRRSFLISAGAAAVAAFLQACSGDDDAGSQSASPESSASDARVSLQPAGEGLSLAEGFSYALLSSTTNGQTPPALDGMARFTVGSGTRLVRNHERRDPPGAVPPLDAGAAYDAKASGGTTTMVLGPDGRSLTSEFVSLSGTLSNCAGGETPWGTWLTCEEATDGPEQGYDQPHGYVFEVAADADVPSAPVPIQAMGRFLHEAVAVDPSLGTVYLTEDNGYDSGLYRFTPTAPPQLADGGVLEMLAVVDQPGYDTAFGQSAGITLPVTWVPIADPNPATAGTDTSAVFNQGLAAGGARFKRLEGCCLVQGVLFVAATEGGDAGLGQVWALDLATSELRLVVESTAPDQLFGPDSLTPAAAGSLVVCEDNSERNRLLVLTAEGSLVPLAENTGDTTEFAGTCFSADGMTLYVNLYGDAAAQVPGRTFAIWGPWDSLR